MKWVAPEHSKKSVQRSGNNLINSASSTADFQVLSNWRASHAYPMHAIFVLLKRLTLSVAQDALVVQRLKRTPSILSKLKRESGMQLHRMEDLGGCRAVVPTVSDVANLVSKLRGSRTKHRLHRIRDYLSNPKHSGYRGVHMVYQYGGTKREFSGLAIEVQIRSKIQHSWATALEVAGIFTNCNLKAGEGDQEWLDYFRYASAELAKLEGGVVHPDFYNDESNIFEKLSTNLNALDRFRAFSSSSYALEGRIKNGKSFFLLDINYIDRKIKIIDYQEKDFANASDDYGKLEIEYRDDNSRDAVLVSAASILELKEGYPNYFSDTTDFLENLEKARKARMTRHRTLKIS